MNPQIVQLYSRNELEEMKSLVDDNFRWNFALYWLIALPLIFEIDYILGLWLVDVPEYTSIFTIIIVLRSLLKCFERPINSVNFAIGNMKPLNLFATASVLLTTAFLCLLFIIGYPPYWAFIIDCTSIAFCITYYMYHARKYGVFSFTHFARFIGLPVAIVIVCSTMGTILLRMVGFTGFLMLVYTSCVTTILSSILVFYVLFTKDNRIKIAALIAKRLHLHRN